MELVPHTFGEGMGLVPHDPCEIAHIIEETKKHYANINYGDMRHSTQNINITVQKIEHEKAMIKPLQILEGS